MNYVHSVLGPESELRTLSEHVDRAIKRLPEKECVWWELSGAFNPDSELHKRFNLRLPDPETFSFDLCFEKGYENGVFKFKPGVFEFFTGKVKGSSSPGLPLMYSHTTNSDAFCFGSMLQAAVESRLNMLFELGNDGITIDNLSGEFVDPVECQRLTYFGYCDPTRVFCKDEPIKIGKNSRIVSSGSLVDLLVDQVLIGAEIACCIQHEQLLQDDPDRLFDFPHSIGWDNNKDEKAVMMYRRAALMNKVGAVYTSDVSGFDFSFGLNGHKLYKARIISRTKQQSRLLSRVPNASRLKVIEARFWCMAHPVFVTSDGSMYASVKPIMRSGELKTAHGDSEVRTMLPCIIHAGKHIMNTQQFPIALPYATANGDDCFEQYFGENFVADYASLGFAVTDVNKFDGKTLNFCSSLITENRIVPESYGKGLFSLLSKEVDVAMWAEFLDRYVRKGLVDRQLVARFVNFKPNVEEIDADIVGVLCEDV